MIWALGICLSFLFIGKRVFSFEIFWDTLPDFTRSTMTSTYISPHNLLGIKLFYFRIQLSKIPD